MEENKINLIPEGKTEVFHASQDDNGRVIRCNLADGAETITLAGTEGIVLRYKKPNGETSSLAIENTFAGKTYVDITIPEELTETVGAVFCKLRINSIGAKTFILLIEERP